MGYALQLNLGEHWVSLVAQGSACSLGDAEDGGSIPGLGRSPERGHGSPFQYSCLGKILSIILICILV